MLDSAKRFLLLCAFAALTLSGAANAQGVRIGNASSAPVSTATLLSTKVLVPVPSAVVQFCLAPASGVPCVNKATTYTDATLLTPCATSTQVVLDGTTSCVATTDSLGNWGVWVPAGVQYAYTFTSSAGNFGPYYVTGSIVSGAQLGANNAFTGTNTFSSLNGILYVGIAAGQYASLQAAHDALPSTGGTVFVAATGTPFGAGTTTLAMTKPMHIILDDATFTYTGSAQAVLCTSVNTPIIEGSGFQGGGSAGGTIISVTNTAANGFDFNTCPGAQIRNLNIVGPSSGTGKGLIFTGNTGVVENVVEKSFGGNGCEEDGTRGNSNGVRWIGARCVSNGGIGLNVFGANANVNHFMVEVSSNTGLGAQIATSSNVFELLHGFSNNAGGIGVSFISPAGNNSGVVYSDSGTQTTDLALGAGASNNGWLRLVSGQAFANAGTNNFIQTSQSLFAAGSAANPTQSFIGSPTTGFYDTGGGTAGFSSAGTANEVFSTTSHRLGSGLVYSWSSNVNPTAAGNDTGLSRDSAGVVDVGNGTAGNTTGSLKLATVTTAVSLNGTCVVSATQTLQACINTFPSGNGDIFIPNGTWSSAAAITISGNGQSSIRITGAGRNSIIKYTGGGVIQAVIDIGTSTPTVQLLSSLILRDFTISGNTNSVHAIRLQGVQTSTLQDIDGRDVTGSALQWLFGTGNRINHWITSATDGIGSFSPVPTGCLELGELGSTTFGFTTTTIDTPRCESVSGTAIKMTNAQVNSMTAAQVSTVGTALDIEPGAGAVSSLQNSFTSSLFESSSNADGVIVNGLQTHFYDSQIATLGVGKLHIKASNNFIEGGQVGTAGITIDAGVKNTHIHHLSMTPTLLTDNGTATQLVNNFDPGTGGPWVVNGITNKEVIPASGVVSDLPTSDPMDHAARGCWKFIGTAATVISPTVMTTGKPWRALFQGVWENDTDGAGLAQLAEEQDVTSVANTLAIGTITMTFTVNGSGQFQGVNSASNTMFCGTITMNPNPNGAVGTSSMTLKGGVSTTQINMTGAGSAVDFNVVSSNAFRNNSAGGSYFFDLGNATFRNGDSTPGGTVNFSGQVLPTVVNTSDLGSAALPFRALWLGTAATNNFKFQPAATAAARVISIPDPLAAENLALIDTMTVNFIPKAASSSTSRLSPTLESDDGTTMTYTGTGGYSAPRLVSTVATGTAPLTVTSTTAVANLKVQNLSAVSGGDLPSAAGGTDVGSTALPYGNLWLGTAATNNFKFQPAATSGARIITMADPLSPTTVAMPYVIANGTTTLTANAALAAVTAQAVNTTAATGTLTTDAIEWAFASAPTAGDSLCHVLAYVTAGNVNFVRANPTAAPQNVSAIVINWRVIR